MRVKIKVGGSYLDTFSNLDDEFYITKQVFDLTTLETRKAEYTRTISVPPSSNNKNILNLETNEILENRRKGAELILDGITVVFAQLLITRYTENNIEFILFSGGFDLFDNIPNASVRELNLSAYDFPYTLAGLSAINANTSGVTFSSIDHFSYDSMDDGTKPNIINTTSRPIDHFGIQIYAKTLLREIIEQAGYTYTDITDSIYDRLFVSIPLNVPAISPTGQSAEVKRATNSFIYDAFGSLGLPEIVQFNQVVNDPFSLWTNYKFTIVNTNTYFISTTIIYDYIKDSNGEMTFGITQNGTTLTSYSRGTGIINDTQNLSIIAQLAAGDQIEVFVEADYLNATRYDIVEIKIDSNFLINENPSPVSGPLRVSEWIPEINQRSFVLDMCKIFNAAIKADPFTKQAELVPMNTIIASSAQDLSLNLDTTEDPVNEISLPYFRESLLTYSNDQIEREDTEYTAYFTADESLPKNGTLINSLFSASDFQPGDPTQTRLEMPYFEMTYQVVQGFSITVATTLYNTLNDNDFKPGDWFFDGTDYYRIATVINKRSGNLWLAHPTGFSGDVQRVTIREQNLTPRLGLYRSLTGTGGSQLNYNAFGPNTVPTNYTQVKLQEVLTWTEIHNTYYQRLFDALRTPKVITAWMKFTTVQFYQLDMFRTAYIKQLNGTFYINKIEQFKLNEPCRVELIRINQLV